MNTFKPYYHLVALMLLFSCVEPYQPPVTSQNIDILVVDGSVDATNNSATVKLSRAIPLASIESIPAEENATVSIEEMNGSNYLLTEQKPGYYTVAGVSFSSANKYRLKIKTTNGGEFESEFIDILQTPAIDSVTWKATDSEIDIFVNTHDDENATRFYKWNYEETWEYNVSFYSGYEWVNEDIIPRSIANSIYLCWRSNLSTNILLGNSSNLIQDVISDAYLLSIERGSRKLNRTYSILVKQQALSKRAYDYWLQLQTTTENVGSLFDPLPSEVTGNIYNVKDRNEPVLGFFLGSTISEKRMFINSSELPKHLRAYWTDPNCKLDSIPLNEIKDHKDAIFISTYGMFFPEGYQVTSATCGDCRTAGGTTTKPSFWP